MKFHIALLWIISFLIVLPLLAQRWVYSPLFYSTKSFRAMASDLVDELNGLRYANAFYSSEKLFIFTVRSMDRQKNFLLPSISRVINVDVSCGD